MSALCERIAPLESLCLISPSKKHLRMEGTSPEESPNFSSHILAGCVCPEAQDHLPCSLAELHAHGSISSEDVRERMWPYPIPDPCAVPEAADIFLAEGIVGLDPSWLTNPLVEGKPFPSEVGEIQKGESGVRLGINRGQGFMHALKLVQLLGPALNSKLIAALWSRDGHAPSILAQLVHAELVQRKSVFTTGMPGTGKTRSLALACVITALAGQRRVIYTTVSNESVNSVISCLDKLLSWAHATVRAACKRIPKETAAWIPPTEGVRYCSDGQNNLLAL